MITLTHYGMEKFTVEVREMRAKQKEIVDSGADTARCIALPTLDDLLADIARAERGSWYVGEWWLVDNLDVAWPIVMRRGRDYVGTVEVA